MAAEEGGIALTSKAALANRITWIRRGKPVGGLAVQLRALGYDIRQRDPLDSAETSYRNIDALVVEAEDLNDVRDCLTGIGASASRPPLLLLGPKNDFHLRLAAVQAGADSFLAMPADSLAVADALEFLLRKKGEEAGRVLVIEDSPSVSATYAALIESRGMRVDVAADPATALQHIEDFRPDLILMDVNLPGCNGWDLAAVLRQDAGLVGVPILFLSADQQQAENFAALGWAGDDFLTKPVAPATLFAMIDGKLARSKILRRALISDGLTGLLNRRAMVERMESELSFALRYDWPLHVAILDIDHFKSVNDTYGHNTGDAVLRSLGGFLLRRLRRSDAVSRFGGEEFAILLRQADSETAYEVVDNLRRAFSELSFDCKQGEFSVSFSAGLTQAREGDTVGELVRRADEAMYAAKRTGRNRVVASFALEMDCVET